MCHSKLLKLDSEKKKKKKSWVACVYYWPRFSMLLSRWWFTIYKIINFDFAAHSLPLAHIDPEILVWPLTAVLCIVTVYLKRLCSCNKSQMDTAIFCFQKQIRIKWNDSHIIRRFAKKLSHMVHFAQQYLLLLHLEKGHKTISVLAITLE